MREAKHESKAKPLQCVYFGIGMCIGIAVGLYLQPFLLLDNVSLSHSSMPAEVKDQVPSSPLPPTSVLPLEKRILDPKKDVCENNTEHDVGLHNKEDDDMFWLASLASMLPLVEELLFKNKSKIAFMFLTRGPLPLMPLWEKFFQGNDGFYSIYLHCDPSYTVEPPETSVFYKRKVLSKAVEWGKPSMINAERRLLANALLDLSNQRFILLSESCIPLFNFTTVYNYLMKSNTSFVDSFDDPRNIGRGRYNKQMSPVISIKEWRKGSQWFEVNRKLAVTIISDTKYVPVFSKYCLSPCYTDEHYIPTLVNILLPEYNSNRSITWVDWSKPGPHPGRFDWRSVKADFLNGIRFGSTCDYNGQNTSMCFMFARKFVANSLQPLLELSTMLFS